MPTAHAVRPAKELPQPCRMWTDDLLEWKIDALTRVLEQLRHLCSSPTCRPKSFSLNVAVRHVVAETADPESGLGQHLQHLLTGAIAHEITRRADLIEEFHRRFPAHGEVSPAFLTKYVNSRWWCEVFCEMELTRCRDLMEAVEGAVSSARQELHR
jgi:hypothetical protein